MLALGPAGPAQTPLPAGTSLPPAPYLAALAIGAVAVGYGFRARRPAVDESPVLALVPWMLVGSTLYALYSVGAVPAVLRPFAGSPAVYVTVAVLAGGVWLGAEAADLPVPRTLAGVGTAALALSLLAALSVGLGRGGLSLAWPGAALVGATVLGWAGWTALVRLRPEAAETGRVGAVAVLGHAVDGVSTAVGVDVLGFDERTPLSRLVIEFGAEVGGGLGGGWLFVIVKLLVAAGVVAMLAPYVREEPAEGYPLCGLVAAVGLGPGAHNLVLFAIA